MSKPISQKRTEEKVPFFSPQSTDYGSARPQNQGPIQVDPAVLARTMQVLLASQQAAKEHPSAEPAKLSHVSIQQTLALPDGQYVGDVVDEKPNGRGTLTYHPGHERKKYEGQWINGKFHGRGVLWYSNGRKEEGQWENGLQHGQGLIFFPDGAKYEGSFVHDKRYGQGNIRYANGGTYDGMWENDKPHGRGTMTFSSGGSYTGNFVNGNFHGRGKYSYANGNYYDGEWANDKENGQGFYQQTHGWEKGTFKNGNLWNGSRLFNGTTYTLENGKSSVDCSNYCTVL